MNLVIGLLCAHRGRDEELEHDTAKERQSEGAFQDLVFHGVQMLLP